MKTEEDNNIYIRLQIQTTKELPRSLSAPFYFPPRQPPEAFIVKIIAMLITNTNILKHITAASTEKTLLSEPKNELILSSDNISQKIPSI